MPSISFPPENRGTVTSSIFRLTRTVLSGAIRSLTMYQEYRVLAQKGFSLHHRSQGTIKELPSFSPTRARE